MNGADISVLARRLSRVVRVTRKGRAYRYPWCCVLRFGWDSLIGVKSGLVRGVTGARGDGERWVPCGWWHHADPVEVAVCVSELRGERAGVYREAQG